MSTDVGLTFVIRTLTELEDRGPVTAEDEVAGTVDILGVTITGMVGVTEYRDGAVINQAGFHALVERGTFVEARWDAFTSTAVTADQLSLEEDDD